MGDYLMSVFDCLTHSGACTAEMNRGQICVHFAHWECLFKMGNCFQVILVLCAAAS